MGHAGGGVIRLRAHHGRGCRHSHWLGGRWYRPPRARWAAPPLPAVQGRQARVHLPREVDHREAGACLARHISWHEHRHLLNKTAPPPPSKEAAVQPSACTSIGTCSTTALSLAKLRGGG